MTSIYGNYVLPIDTVSVSVGVGHSCRSESGGSAYCWGDNQVGQLGNGTMTDGSTSVVGLNDVTSVSVGASSSCAIRTDGTVACWGSHPGDGTVGNTTPVTVLTQR